MDAFGYLLNGELDKAKEALRAVSAKSGRTFEGACMEGFVSLEGEDHHMAQFYWQEAGRLGQTNVQQCYVQFLQARLREIAGDYREALSLYRQVLMGSSKWLEPTYREGVCMVKMGFTGQSLDIFADLVNREPFALQPHSRGFGDRPRPGACAFRAVELLGRVAGPGQGRGPQGGGAA